MQLIMAELHRAKVADLHEALADSAYNTEAWRLRQFRQQVMAVKLLV